MVTLEPRVRTIHLECRKNLGSPPSSGEAEKDDDCSDGRFVRTAPLLPHKKEALQLVWGASFLSAACERVEQHDPAQQGSNQPCGLLLSAREPPTTGIAKDPQL